MTLHVRLAELTRSGLQPSPTGGLPLDDHVKTVLNGPEIRWMLMPLSRRQTAASSLVLDNPTKAGDVEVKKTKEEKLKKAKADAARVKKLRRTPMPMEFILVLNSLSSLPRT